MDSSSARAASKRCEARSQVNSAAVDGPAADAAAIVIVEVKTAATAVVIVTAVVDDTRMQNPLS